MLLDGKGITVDEKRIVLAIEKGEKSFELKLGGQTWSQEPQKYHARSLAEIRRKYAAAKGAPGLGEILTKADCLRWLVA